MTHDDDLDHLHDLHDLHDLHERDDLAEPGRQPSRLTVRSPADALALVPVVMGFHPEESVVLVTFGGEGFHARVDLPVTAPERTEVVALFVDALRANPCQVVMVVMYSDDEQVCAALAADLVPELVDRLGLGVADVVRADGDRWWSLGHGGEQGPGTPYDVTCHPFTADSVLQGRVVRASRDDLADDLVAHDPDVVEAVAVAASRWAERGNPATGRLRRQAARWLGDTVEGWRRSGRLGTVEEVGRVLVLLDDPGLRDVVWASIDRGEVGEHLALWLRVVRTSPHERSASPLALVALCAWLHGDGAMAWTAVERAREVDPDHSLAALVAEALERAVPPSTWRPLDVETLPAVHG